MMPWRCTWRWVGVVFRGFERWCQIDVRLGCRWRQTRWVQLGLRDRHRPLSMLGQSLSLFIHL